MSAVWTDRALAKCEAEEREAERINSIVIEANSKNSELYRLARLGLAVSKACSWGTCTSAPYSVDLEFETSREAKAFAKHPAWDSK